VGIGNQKRNIISLGHIIISNLDQSSDQREPTCTGFLRSTIKLSARCIINRVNLWQRIRSISSACLIFMLIRIELTEGSMRTRSFSLREIVNGLRRTSLDPLIFRRISTPIGLFDRLQLRCFDLWFVMTFHDLDDDEHIANYGIKTSTYLRREVLKGQSSS
jgi:hypothetical protein